MFWIREPASANGSKQPVGFTDYFDKFIKYAQQNKDVFNTITNSAAEGMLKGHEQAGYVR